MNFHKYTLIIVTILTKKSHQLEGKVLYPPHLYPVRLDAGRQISKELSPAPVANLNSNKYDMSRAPVTPKRTTSATNSDTQNKQTNLLSSKNPFRSDRTVSYPVPDKISKKSDGQFSFMRETSSSLQKKQVLTPVNESVPPVVDRHPLACPQRRNA